MKVCVGWCCWHGVGLGLETLGFYFVYLMRELLTLVLRARKGLLWWAFAGFVLGWVF